MTVTLMIHTNHTRRIPIVGRMAFVLLMLRSLLDIDLQYTKIRSGPIYGSCLRHARPALFRVNDFVKLPDPLWQNWWIDLGTFADQFASRN